MYALASPCAFAKRDCSLTAEGSFLIAHHGEYAVNQSSGQQQIQCVLAGEGQAGPIGSIRRVGRSWGPGGQCIVHLDPRSVTFTPRGDGAVVTASIVSQVIVEDGAKKTVAVDPPQRVSVHLLELDAESRAALLKAAGNPEFKGELVPEALKRSAGLREPRGRSAPPSRGAAALRAGVHVTYGDVGDFGNNR